MRDDNRSNVFRDGYARHYLDWWDLQNDWRPGSVPVHLFRSPFGQIAQFGVLITVMIRRKEDRMRVLDSSMNFILVLLLFGIVSTTASARSLLDLHSIEHTYLRPAFLSDEINTLQYRSRAIVLANQSARDSPVAKFFPIELVCPSSSNGTLDLISENNDGSKNRMRVLYEANRPKSVEAAVAFKGEMLRPLLTIVLSAANHPIDQSYGEELAAKSNSIKANVCEGSSSNRKRYLDALAKNKMIFIKPSKDH